MGGSAQPSDRSFRVSPMDHLGRRISPVVLDAAEEIGRRAIQHAEKLRIDPAIAATLLEQAAATVSRALEVRRPCIQSDVQDIHSYLFRAFIRRINRVKKRELIVGGPIQTLSFDSFSSIDPRKGLELKILVDELLTKCDPVTRDMFFRWIRGFSWKEIGSLHGISSYAAKSRFSKAFRRVAEKLGLRRASRLKRNSPSGSEE